MTCKHDGFKIGAGIVECPRCGARAAVHPSEWADAKADAKADAGHSIAGALEEIRRRFAEGELDDAPAEIHP